MVFPGWILEVDPRGSLGALPGHPGGHPLLALKAYHRENQVMYAIVH